MYVKEEKILLQKFTPVQKLNECVGKKMLPIILEKKNNKNECRCQNNKDLYKKRKSVSTDFRLTQYLSSFY